MASIRKAMEKDLPRLIELYEQLAQGGAPDEKNPTELTDRHSKALSDIFALPGFEVIVAEEGDTVIGTMTLSIIPNLTHGGLPWAIVENVVVDSTCRRTGVGKMLMDYVVEKATEAGCYKVQLMSDKRRTESHKFYQSIGYQPTAEGFRLYL
ncbi:MAG: GNAT family N-acetyltransferase [Dehalococcoidales bacterium]|nr:GNAT family N-acetyltransferase [Dehalococcoidales bacterium]